MYTLCEVVKMEVLVLCFCFSTFAAGRSEALHKTCDPYLAGLWVCFLNLMDSF